MAHNGFAAAVKLLGKKVYLYGLLALGVLLLVLPKSSRVKSADPAPVFQLEAEEKRLEQALSRIEGVGQVTVLLTLEASAEQEYARDTEENRESGADGGLSSEGVSRVTEMDSAPLTVRYLYPRYRGALVVIQGGGSAAKLAVTQAVVALTGLGSDRVTVVKGG